MPYTWTEIGNERRLRVWPHQSLTARGFVWFIGATAGLLLLPLLAVLGSPVLWVLMIFLVLAIAAIWWAIMRNKSEREICEELVITPTQVHLVHTPRKGAALTWDANPYWVTIHMAPKGKVENYLTLKGNGREVELGAFLDASERLALYEELQGVLRPD